MFQLLEDLYESCKLLSALDIFKRIIIVIVSWFFQSMMLFAMNFMLDSFTDSRSNSYTTLLTMALLFLVFAIAFLIVMICLAFFTKYFETGRLAFRNLFTWEHVGQLSLLGLFDCLGGVTGTYAAPNTPIAIQFAILATSVAWTFPFAKWLVKDRDRPCTPLVFFSTMLTIAGAAVTIVPHWKSLEGLRGAGSEVGWILIFVLAALFPLFLNVLYARYLVVTVDNNGKSIISVDGGAVSNRNTFAFVIDDEISVHTTNHGNTAALNNNNNLHQIEDDVVDETASQVSTPSATPQRKQQQKQQQRQHQYQQQVQNETDDYDYDNDRKPMNTNSSSSAIATPSPKNQNNNHGIYSDQSLNTRINSNVADSSNSLREAKTNTNNNITTTPTNSTATAMKEISVITSQNWSYFLSKLSIAMFGDAFFQCVFVLVLLPLDFTPWFGAASSAGESWAWLANGFQEVYAGGKGGTTMTPTYFVLYTFGFFMSHILGASLSYYSPQLAAFIFSVNTPLNLLWLVVFPSWNVFGQVAPAWASITSIVLTAIGAFTYAAWEHGQRMEQRKRREEEEEKVVKSAVFPVDEDDAKQNASAATMSFG